MKVKQGPQQPEDGERASRGPSSAWAEVGGVASVVQVSLSLPIARLWRFGNCHKEW